MCASLLRQFKIRAVYFGAANERFGGTGGVLSIHDDVFPGENAGDGGAGKGEVVGGDGRYKAYGGIFREEAILLLRRFYVQDNEKVPVEKARKKDRELKVEIEHWEIHSGLARKEGSSIGSNP
jgi:tRNA-specific adenosine deaminase 2